ncbi:hypothetical protein BN946_scf184857.g17 [Trametes cinnabarina]|uniref:Uncharacterized protein n=1 Tax=Pycnoporus cinnabarinus TaxID=5643 RepID=A0A060SSS0_PYCCI|nr:hypothetical protein BN946_scf184857.g17 [Trametes cinnabarina]
MFIYPIALVAAFLFGALTDLSLLLLPPTLARFKLSLLTVAPSRLHSLPSRSLLSGTFVSVNASTLPLDDAGSHYGGCLNLEFSSWVVSRRVSPPAIAIAGRLSSALVLSAPINNHMMPVVSQAPLADSESHRQATSTSSWNPYLVDLLVFCTWMTALCWLSRGFAIVACVFFHRLALAVNVQRMDSPWTFYSPGLLARETSCVACHCGAPGLLGGDSRKVGRIASGVCFVLPPMADPPGCVSEPEMKKISTVAKSLRGHRGGRRQHRRQNAVDLRGCPDVHGALQAAHEARAERLPVAATADLSITASAPAAEAVEEQHLDSALPSELELGSIPSHGSLTLDDEWLDGGRAGESIALGPPLRYYRICNARPPSSREEVPGTLPARVPATVLPPLPLAVTAVPLAVAAHPPQAPSNAIIGRTYSHCDKLPSVKPGTIVSRRRRAPAPNLATATVRVIPSGKLNQRARRALATRTTLGQLLQRTDA